jgi:hypothetical protein
VFVCLVARGQISVCGTFWAEGTTHPEELTLERCGGKEKPMWLECRE